MKNKRMKIGKVEKFLTNFYDKKIYYTHKTIKASIKPWINI